MIKTIVITIAIITIVMGTSKALDRAEIVECNQWAKQAEEFGSAFYLTQWQADQCNAHNISINAIVK